MLKRIMLNLIILSFSLPTWAEMTIEGEEVKEEKVFLKAEADWEPGKPIRLRISDGRVAEMKIASLKDQKLTTKLLITENLCTGIISQSCKFESTADIYNIEFKWIQHPDPEKIGKIVIDNDGDPIEGTSYINIHDKVMGYQHQNLNPPRLVCDSYKWLTGDDNDNTKIDERFLSWDLERNQNNEETGINENRFTFGYINLKLQSQETEITPELTSIEYIYGNQFFSSLPPFILAQATTIVKEKANGDICTINLQPDSSELIAELQDTWEKGDQKSFVPKDWSELKRILFSVRFGVSPQKIQQFNSYSADHSFRNDPEEQKRLFQ